MKPMHGTTVRCAWLLAWALGVVPLGAQPRPGDRVYTADQVSNTVSVIDPVRNEPLGVLPLGDPFPAGLSPLYRGALLVHGLGFSPDGRTLAVVSIGSNSVTLLETATLRVRATVYVGRAPHEAFFTPDGRELWVAVRGENYVSVIDPNAGREVRRIPTADGPAMVLFRPDGRYAFVPSSFVPELTVIDVRAHRPVARVRQVSAFSPNLAVSRDGREVWVTLKDVGKVQVIEARPPFATKAVLETGPITNHVALVDAPTGSFAYVTVGGRNEVQVYRRGPVLQRVATIPVGDLPHGVWAAPDGQRVYVGLENGDAVVAIDTRTNTVVATIPVGQLPQALVYVPGAAPQGRDRTALRPLGEAARRWQRTLLAASGGRGRASVVVNSLGVVDHLQIAAVDLDPGRAYRLELVVPGQLPLTLARLVASPAGVATAQSIGPVKRALQGDGAAVPGQLRLVAEDNGVEVLIEAPSGP